MFDEKKLWRERFNQRMKEFSRYSRYILNGHIVIVLIFLLGTAAYYYQEWLKTIPEQFPAAAIMAVVIGLLLTYSPISTFLSEADKIFLLPLESKLSRYFFRSITVSYAVHAYLIFLGLGVFIPMYARVNDGNFDKFMPFLFVILIIKVLNVIIRWKVQYFVETKVHIIDSFVRYAINTVFLFFLFSNAKIIFLIPEVVLLMGLLFFYQRNTRDKGLKWEYLIEMEERRMTSFYRLANLFTDVPKLRDHVKRRKWLDWVFSRLSFAQQDTFSHLYVRTFLRAGDYFGLYVRLTLICIGVFYFISFGLGQAFIALLFIYLTGFQLLPLWNHYQNKLWIMLYPIREEMKEKAFKRLLLMVLYLQTILLAIAILLKGDVMAAIITLIAGIGFAYLFTNVYITKRLKS
ncbi:ABC transporter permease [Bacillus sp. DTU_2020_1000418_1_SI_GHA_SEK_038]|uniref:ABC transporter permease n=1 Tax=Bacillus sp. DTU_2020_1000418_1_SI_GHA_SEK_038 TaxID=3077585 RepID=UPI0028E2AF17|nr:ABC transporter permease [Bacillus sp. DTU_2020_1000418_1_SI_GHA_SEK_038]WNS76774.1 ABC transporter permease [Bacillus sp. DTU_2020_1000418_1_SI_GHA_SEK_038]